MTGKDLIRYGEAKLATSKQDISLAKYLVLYYLKIDNFNTKINIINQLKYKIAILKLCKSYPPQYITKSASFYGYDLYINKNVLIPRFATEELVEKTLYHIKKNFDQKKTLTIADIGTGSGAIIITLGSELIKLGYKVNLIGVDISSKALKVAKKNAIINNIKIDFIKGNILDPLIKSKIKVDILISNPPYIDINDANISYSTKKYEPKTALFAKKEGYYFYNEIANKMNIMKNKPFLLAIEHGFLQQEKIQKIFKKRANSEMFCYLDIEKRPRIIVLLDK